MGDFSFNSRELSDLGKAWIVLSIAFAILQVGLKFSTLFLEYLAISAFTVGSGFLLHELSHKYFAQKFGCKAEFKAFPLMLAITLISSLFGFIFAAPGAVFISGNVSKRRTGQVSLAGPIMNIILAVAFFFLGFVSANSTLQLVSSIGSSINAWLALFNLIPFGPLDGRKVWYWSRGVWVVFTLVSLALVLLF